MTHSRHLVAALVLAALSWARPADAQVFLASKPHPEFSVGPVFVIANVKPDLSVTVNLSFSLTPRTAARPDALEQDLYLLWPAELSEATAPGRADPTLAAEVEKRGFEIVASGRLALRSRDRMLLGTGQLGAELREPASFVAFIRRGPIANQVGPVTYVKLPYASQFSDPLSIITLVLPLRGLVTTKPASWISEMFWGRRHILTIGFGDLGSPAMPLYPLYFEHRDRAIRLAREYSVVTASFADSDHLLIDAVEPPAATRRPSRVRAGSEVVTLPLSPTDSLTPQSVKVQFSYFAGRIAWRPIVVSIILLLLGNVAGAVMFGREVVHMVRTRRRKRAAMALHRGPWLSPDGLRSFLPGVATYDDVVARWGPPDEERERIAPPGRLTVFYRATRDGRLDEIAIELEHGRVAEVLRTTRRVDH